MPLRGASARQFRSPSHRPAFRPMSRKMATRVVGQRPDQYSVHPRFDQRLENPCDQLSADALSPPLFEQINGIEFAPVIRSTCSLWAATGETDDDVILILGDQRDLVLFQILAPLCRPHFV